MARSLPRILALSVVLAHVAIACDDGDLNPQPLPPRNGNTGVDSPSTGGGSGEQGNGDTATPTVGTDAGAADTDAGPDGGADAGHDAG